MARSDRILAIDIGATSIKIGEFEYPSHEGVCLVAFDHREYEEELTEASRSVVVAGLLRQMLVEGNFGARRCVVSISGQAAFTRFVRLPPVANEETRIRQIVEFEARQNVPFPMEEVIWDYQLIRDPEAVEMDVMFVVIKNDIVEQMTAAVQSVGLDPLLVDVAPAACYNAARANHVGDDECSMILNVGGRSTNLLFADGPRFFARTIPIAGHTVTQQIAKEFGIGVAEAEELKRRHGFVALGGAYAEPESEVAAAVSKIIRNVMARLHSEINRSISVYRSQQKGNRPVRLFLTGGSSAMTYTDHFFSEKLRMEVNYLNPFQVVALGPAVDRVRLQEVAHMFTEVIGLGLRYRIRCPIEVSLVPETIRRQQAFRRKKPFIAASMTCALVVLLVMWQASVQRSASLVNAYESVQEKRTTLDGLSRKIQSAQNETARAQTEYEGVKELLLERKTWPTVLNHIFELKPKHLWVVGMEPVLGGMEPDTGDAGGMGMMGEMEGGEMGMMGGSSSPFGGGSMGGGEMGMMGGEMGGGEMGMMGGGEMGMMGGGEMGMMGGGGMGMGMDAGPAGQYVDISGLIILGHSVGKLEAEEALAIPTAPADSADDGAAEDTPAVDEDGGDPEAADDGDGDTEEADTDGDDGDDGAPEVPAVDPNEDPALIYLTRLKASGLFDVDEQFTYIRSYRPGQSVRNLSSFTIQVKFAEPLQLYYVQTSTQVGN